MSHGSCFLGSRTPMEVDLMVKQLKDLDKEIFRKILKAMLKFCTTDQILNIISQKARLSSIAVVNSLEGKDSRESVRSIVETESLSEEQLSYILAGMYTLLGEALRLPQTSLKQEVFKGDLRDLRIPEEFISDFASVVFGNRRSVLETAALQNRTRLPTLKDFRWRVDVAISSSSLTRALQPAILMQLKLSNGNVHRFEVLQSALAIHNKNKENCGCYVTSRALQGSALEAQLFNSYINDLDESKSMVAEYTSASKVPVSKFQEMRYNVALILKEMNDLEKRSILKIQD